ncbi:MAG: Crossover junction endodeoxyribonuclease RuvC [Pelotomaculum sp. PtaU1.Bin035]|nr:MAG: Crossover junction endodeoxyribonuclease RuvC [Pelotomaculum sp. PtaU1.Bin035]
MVYNLRVLAVDPGLALTGYAVLDYQNNLVIQLVEGGIIKTRPGISLEDRLKQIYSGLEEILHEFNPNVIAIEELFSDYKNPKTALLMAHARGVCLLAAGQSGIKAHHYSATQIKQSVTGTGGATKSQVQRMVQAALGLESPPSPDHIADAIAVALCHISHCHDPEVLK